MTTRRQPHEPKKSFEEHLKDVDQLMENAPVLRCHPSSDPASYGIVVRSFSVACYRLGGNWGQVYGNEPSRCRAPIDLRPWFPCLGAEKTRPIPRQPQGSSHER